MKNYRNLVPVVLIALMLLSFYKLNSDASQEKNQYDSLLAQAREQAGKGVTSLAMDSYQQALDLQPSLELYKEIAEFHRSQGDMEAWLNWCEKLYEQYPTDPRAYDCVLEAYLEEKDYASCYNVLETAQKRKLFSDYMNTVENEIAYNYSIDTMNNFEDVGVFCSGYSAVKNNDLWGYVDVYGKNVVPCNFQEAGVFFANAPVVTTEGEVYYINSGGTKVLPSAEGYQRLGILAGDILAAQRKDGKYEYLNSDYEVLFGEYDYASAMNAGIGAVRNGEQWTIIDSSGNAVIQSGYADIKLDGREIAYRNDRLFVKDGDGYIMIDISGKQIGSLIFEDACLFEAGDYAAVKINGSWCFVDKDGNLKSDQIYQEAHSYANGLAAVKIDGKWGFVDLEEELRIPAEYDDVKNFNDKGSCFIKQGEYWQLLKLYRLNR